MVAPNTSQRIVARFLSAQWNDREEDEDEFFDIGEMYVVFLETPEGPVYNTHITQAIKNIELTVSGWDEKRHKFPLYPSNQQYSGPPAKLPWKLEDGGLRETRVKIMYPMDYEGDRRKAEQIVLKELQKLGRRLGFKVKRADQYYRPKVRY